MNQIGVIEGFFGPQWPHPSRMSYATFLSKYGGNFYIYAPKQDANLRKKWREVWTSEYRTYLQELADLFNQQKLTFGVGFSPFGLGTSLTDVDKAHLQEKVKLLQDLKVGLIGLFFDDMPITENLAATQLETLSLIRSDFKGQIIFCPSYYTPDPILDKVFGQRPPDYLKTIGQHVPQDILIAWTGPKVISPELPETHLRETIELLHRKPFIWENLYANDGPKNCKFLKLKAFTGRTADGFNLTSGFGFNMMNQPGLSKVTYLSSLLVLKEGKDPEAAFANAVEELCSEGFAHFLHAHSDELLQLGLDNFSAEDKKSYIEELKSFPDEAAKEIIDWLSGNYIVGSECLTD